MTAYCWRGYGSELVTVVGNSILLGRYRPRYAAAKPKEEQVYSDRELKSVYTLS
jgi:hypothetical protein